MGLYECVRARAVLCLKKKTKTQKLTSRSNRDCFCFVVPLSFAFLHFSKI